MKSRDRLPSITPILFVLLFLVVAFWLHQEAIALSIFLITVTVIGLLFLS